jgi:hypothetical protein
MFAQVRVHRAQDVVEKMQQRGNSLVTSYVALARVDIQQSLRGVFIPSHITLSRKSQCLPASRRICLEERLFGQRRHPCPVPRLVPSIIPARIMDGDSVVPERRGTRRPSEADLYIDILLVHVVQVIQYQIALVLVEAEYALGHRAVDPQRLPTSCGMNANKRMNSLHEFRASIWVFAIKVRVRTSIHGFLAVDDLSEGRAQLFISCVA